MEKLLSLDEVKASALELLAEGYHADYNTELHKILFEKEESKERIALRLPLSTAVNQVEGELKFSEKQEFKLLICLIQSGSAAVGWAENGELVNHKALGAYMSRKKQGKSQIKYLKTKGKSKAGSRVRLASTITFFENINEKMTDYLRDKPADIIAISCSKILLPYLYNSKVACPFEKKDERLYKIPKDIAAPNLKVLEHVHHYLTHGELVKL
jgi:hypothetical protein